MLLIITPGMLPASAALSLGAAWLAVLVLGAKILLSHLTSPLRAIPESSLARFTDVWGMIDSWRHSQIRSRQELHRKYGVAVRLGPNMVSLSDPALLKTVYSTRGDFVKVS